MLAQKSSFFDTTPDDPREYPAREFAEYFSRFIGNGIFGGGTSLKVEPAGGNHKVVVSLGYGWINGYLYRVYDAPITLSVDQASGTNRIDRIVLRLDTSIHKRSIEVVVKKGASPTVAPTLTRAGDVYELSLAQILVQNGGTIIIGSQITDERLNTSLCGIVTGVISQADTTSIFNQFQSWYNTKTVAYQQEWDSWFSAIKVTLQGQWDDWMEGLQSATPVLSVNGKGGTVVLSPSDIGANAATDYIRQPGYGTTAGTSTAYTLTLTPALPALVAGVCVSIKAHIASGANPTLNIDSKGAKAIKKSSGSAAVLANGGLYTLRYDGTAFILQGEGSEERSGHVIAQSISRSGTTLRFRPQEGYYPGDVANSVQWSDPNWIAANIPDGISMFGLQGTKMIPVFAEGQASLNREPTPASGYYYWVLKVRGLSFKPNWISFITTNSNLAGGVSKFGSGTEIRGSFSDTPTTSVLIISNGTAIYNLILYDDGFDIPIMRRADNNDIIYGVRWKAGVE